ncbi:Glycosyl transferase family 2 [Symmachiella dynata]|uniref:glycosyltransferase n=1 Tax=Symmachiella dynata TaxID=2527995 RepID=UPI00118B968B|nr:glycosyltransferase [Symmachiella dynata]QDT47269.1 Glycosyl transferase family 2 [Symmachiella dynata]
MSETLGVVVIGRNEGERLRRCLESVKACGLHAVYVDSGSSDDSVQIAQSIDFTVVNLDLAIPFTAARARSEGYDKLLQEYPNLKYVMFVDGDCEIELPWPRIAETFLQEHEEVGIVAGRRRERFPEASVYNRLCDFEWDAPTGQVAAIGGDSIVRVSAYQAAGGFNPTVPAGEEPELCSRIRAAGWKVWRINTEMTRHDAAMSHFGQWWKRLTRTGYGGFDVERRFKTGVFQRILYSAFVWGILIPLLAVIAAVTAYRYFGVIGAVAVVAGVGAVWLLQILRITVRTHRLGRPWRQSLEYGWFTMLAKFPIAMGSLKSLWACLTRQGAQIIEYKSAVKSPSA